MTNASRKRSRRNASSTLLSTPHLYRRQSIVGSHTLIPDALYHAFSTFGALMSPDLPLTRRQHEMITTIVSVTNRCHY